MAFQTPLRWPGGKRRLAYFIQQLRVHNGAADGVYAEPFAGGAAVAVALLLAGQATRVELNDADPGIYAFWKAVLYDTRRLAKLIAERRATWKTRELAERVYAERLARNDTELGWAVWFLNRTSHAGIPDAGPVGGRQGRPDLRMTARYNPRSGIARIEAIGARRDAVRLDRRDATVWLRDFRTRCGPDAFVFADPPYMTRGERLYALEVSQKGHEELAAAMRALPCRWSVAYEAAAATRRLYDGEPAILYNRLYTSYGTSRADELLILGRGVAIPPGAETEDGVRLTPETSPFPLWGRVDRARTGWIDKAAQPDAQAVPEPPEQQQGR